MEKGKELIEKTEKLVRNIRKNLYGEENNRQIRSFLNLFPTLEKIISSSNLSQQDSIRDYNENLKEIYDFTPNLVLSVWGIYRRNLFVTTFIVDSNQINNLTPEKLDIYMAKRYIEQVELLGKTPTQEWISEENGGIYGPLEYPEFYSIDKENPFELVDITKITTIPINLYHFKNKFTGKQIKTIYDLSSNEIPFLEKFSYDNMELETRLYFHALKNAEHLKPEYLDSYYKELE